MCRNSFRGLVLLAGPALLKLVGTYNQMMYLRKVTLF